MQQVQRIETQSKTDPGQMNVFIEAGSFEACQAIIFNVMEEYGTATFTLPTKADNGSYCAIGHYAKSGEELPEL